MSQKSSCCTATVTAVHRPGLSCSACSLFFHYKCVNLDKANYIDCLENTTVSWSCLKCQKSKKSRRSTIIPATLQSNKPISAATPSTSKERPSSKTPAETKTNSPNFAQLSAELKEIREKNQESFKQLHNLIAQLCKRVDDLEKLKETIETLKLTTIELENKTDTNERKLIANSVEIQGISRSFNPLEVASEISLQIDAPIASTDIKKCYFKEIFARNLKKYLLIIEFHSNLVKRNFVSKGKIFTRSQKKLVFQDEQVIIHVNDQLSSYQKKLLYETKELAKVHKFEFVWIFNSQILVKKAFGLQPACVRSFEDLNNLVQL